MEDLNHSWAAVLNGGHHAKVIHRLSWRSPPVGIFKLNFDGSFLQSAQRGGFGGVIKDWNGNVIRDFSRPVDFFDANEAEVFALLLGWRQLLQLGVCNPILEGDSFSTIQWASGKASHP